MEFLIDAIDVIHDIAVHISGHSAHKDDSAYDKTGKQDDSVHNNPLIKRAVSKDASDIIGIKGLEHAKRVPAIDGSMKSFWLPGNVVEIESNRLDVFMYTV